MNIACPTSPISFHEAFKTAPSLLFINLYQSLLLNLYRVKVLEVKILVFIP